MARTPAVRVEGQKAVPEAAVSNPVQERRVATPRPDLFVIKIGDGHGKLQVSPKEQTTDILARLAKSLTKPGANRARVFLSSSGRPVYAYSIHTDDPTKIVRENASGQQTVGRFVGGRFRPIRPARAK
jgi:hypothetical protein